MDEAFELPFISKEQPIEEIIIEGVSTRSGKKNTKKMIKLGLKEGLDYLNSKNHFTDFAIEDVSNKMNGNVDLIYYFEENKELDYIIKKKLVDLLHMSKFLFEYYDTIDNQECKNFTIFKKLIETYGKEIIDIQDENGVTPLMYVVQYTIEYSTVVVKLLLDAGADIHLKDKHGNNVYYYNRQYNNQPYINKVKKILDIVKNSTSYSATKMGGKKTFKKKSVFEKKYTKKRRLSLY